MAPHAPSSPQGTRRARRPLPAVVVGALVLGTVTAAGSGVAAAAPTAPSSPVTPAAAVANAAAGAAGFVARRPSVVRPGAGDTYVAGAVQTGTGGLQYVPYSRRYDGLPVLGGDFVVVTDSHGTVLSTSAGAQDRPLTLPTARRVTPAAAAATAATRLAGGTVASTRAVVDAAQGAPAVAYESVVTGRVGARPSRLHVVVDATSGAVRRSWDEVSDGVGTGAYNGPNPLAITTAGSGSSFRLSDPSRPGTSCRAFTSKAVLTGTDDNWGNGNPASAETGCVDALYDVQTQWSMLADWLGRDGISGRGTGFPIYMGLDDTNAYWDGQGVSIGRNTANGFLSAMDIVGHEFGHAIDSTTPGGQSANGVSEATGDIFGTALEYFANQSSAYDAPDWTIGEEVDLLGSGPIRNMANPGAVGDPACYSSAIPNAETHRAAGPFDHWFYLVAGGRAAAGGAVTSRCTATTVSGGLGVKTALTVFYNAMLAKTGGMTYPRYRTATLTAARNLTPGDCSAFTTVKAAWDAVKVPAQSADPTCTGSATPVTVADPGARSGVVGTAITPFTLSATGGGGSYTWSATGLPAGLTLGASTGTVSGTPTAAGTYAVTATATSGTAKGSTTFSVVVSSAGACAGGQKLVNGGFESTGGWTASDGVISTSTTNRPARTGSGLAYLGGYGQTHTDVLRQTVRVPAGCSAVTVGFWVRVITAETAGTAFDTLVATYGSTTVASVSNLAAGTAYVARTATVAPSATAQSVTLTLTAREDASLQTSFLVDDVSVTVS